MTDHAGEQEMELEALAAILMDDLEEYEGMLPPGWSGHGATYKVQIRPTEDVAGDEGGGDEELALELLFAHTPTYPDEAPCLKPRSVRGLSDADIADLGRALDAVVAENLGMAMVYNLVTAAQEWLAARLAGKAAPDPEAERKRADAEEEARHAALRAHGRPVTAAAFAEWKIAFDAEAAAAAARGGGGEAKGGGGGGGGGGGEGRMTGKAWFLKQAAAGEVVSGSEEEEGDDDDDEEGEEGEEGDAAGGAGGDDEDEDEDDEFDVDEDDEGSDEGDMLESYLAQKAA
ncbi:MAG: ubiquitin-conjugating enzyme/RWD-like protein [Monoraphidium minutum]|nr:MAG: ubiquitin-conjugating enzyme/RWD-like protein [Monoraphidium minutum]